VNLMRLLLPLILVVTSLAPSAGGAQAISEPSLPVLNESLTQDMASAANGAIEDLESEGRLSTAVEIAILLTVLSLLPALLISVTSFTRIIIVLSFVRRAMGVNELPPNPILIGLSLFLTLFIMAPVGERLNERAWTPYQEGTMSLSDASGVAWEELSGFLIANTRETELELFADLARVEHNMEGDGLGKEDLPLRVLVPAFVLSELKTAFQMGFLVFLPFLVIDLIVSTVLLSMGMFMLPPVMISTPFKILVFVLVDGWHLVANSIVTSFVTT